MNFKIDVWTKKKYYDVHVRGYKKSNGDPPDIDELKIFNEKGKRVEKRLTEKDFNIIVEEIYKRGES